VTQLQLESLVWPAVRPWKRASQGKLVEKAARELTEYMMRQVSPLEVLVRVLLHAQNHVDLQSPG
jgi:hypothetical protein